MKLIIGLGNPGKKYENQRHNLGFLVLDKLSEDFNIDLSENKFKALYGKGFIEEKAIWLLKPMTFMNLSGEAVRRFAHFYKIDISDILVISDDLNLNFGRIRIRKSGSDGGHNGLKSIIHCLGSNEFSRVRLGIGLPNNTHDVSSYVLSQFNSQEKEALNSFIEKAKEAITTIIIYSIEKGINLLSS